MYDLRNWLSCYTFDQFKGVFALGPSCPRRLKLEAVIALAYLRQTLPVASYYVKECVSDFKTCHFAFSPFFWTERARWCHARNYGRSFGPPILMLNSTGV